MKVRIGSAGKFVLVVAALVVAACESRPPSYRYVPPPVAQGPNSPFPVPRPLDKPQPDMPIDAEPAGRSNVVAQTLDDVPGGGSAAPAPQPTQAGSQASAPASAAVRPAGKGEKIVIVERGDTVFAIARREGVHPREIIDLNNLQPPYHLSVGQRLRVPTTEHHSVVPGDTIYSISKRYGIGMDALMRANEIGDSYGIVVGQLLVIPPKSATPEPEGAATVAAVVPAADPAPSRPATSDRMPDGFIWPAKGQIISSFGPKKGGLRNDGVNIRVPRGTSVQAVAAGVVVYAGNDLKGFGNLVLLRHEGGWVSAYAHNDDILVSRGQQVPRGATIARAGSSGSVDTPQIHFELRRNARAVDPREFLPPV